MRSYLQVMERWIDMLTAVTDLRKVVVLVSMYRFIESVQIAKELPPTPWLAEPEPTTGGLNPPRQGPDEVRFVRRDKAP
jgi:hypothetical protein